MFPLQHHPDKAKVVLSNDSNAATAPFSQDDAASIHQIYAAHKVLSDDVLRLLYDREIAQSVTANDLGSARAGGGGGPGKMRVSATLDLDAFTSVENDAISGDGDEAFQYPCRCGSDFIVTSHQLVDENVELVECQGCSEVVKVAWKDDEAAASRSE